MTGMTMQGEVPRPMTIAIVDKGQALQVANVDPWVEERKQLLRRARDIIKGYDGNPRTLYPQYGELVRIARRIAEIKIIFDTYNRERNRHIVADITGLVEYFGDPKTMEGVDD